MRTFFCFLLFAVSFHGSAADEYASISPVFDLTDADVSQDVSAYPNTGIAVREQDGFTDFLVAWNRYEPDGVFIQRVRVNAAEPESGAPFGNPLEISAYDDYIWLYTGGYAAAYNADQDEYLVIWRGAFQHEDDPSVDGLFARRVDAETFEPFGGVQQIAGPGAMLPQILWNAASNHYVAAWARYDWGRMSVETRAIGRDGLPLTAVSLIDRTDGKMSNEECEMLPSLAAHGDGYVLAFSNANGGNGAGAFNILLHRLDALGQSLGGRIPLPRESGDNTQFMCNPQLESLGGELLVYWRAYGWNSGPEGWPIRNAVVDIAGPEPSIRYTGGHGLPAVPSYPFGVQARRLADGGIEYLWLEKTYADESAAPEGHQAYKVMARRVSAVSLEDAVEISEATELFRFATLSPSYLFADGRAPFLLGSGGNLVFVNWFEYAASWEDDGRSALRGAVMTADVKQPEEPPAQCAPGNPELPDDEWIFGLWLYAEPLCDEPGARIMVASVGDDTLHDITLKTAISGGESDDVSYINEGCELSGDVCNLADLGANEFHWVTVRLHSEGALDDLTLSVSASAMTGSGFSQESGLFLSLNNAVEPPRGGDEPGEDVLPEDGALENPEDDAPVENDEELPPSGETGSQEDDDGDVAPPDVPEENSDAPVSGPDIGSQAGTQPIESPATTDAPGQQEPQDQQASGEPVMSGGDAGGESAQPQEKDTEQEVSGESSGGGAFGLFALFLTGLAYLRRRGQ